MLGQVQRAPVFRDDGTYLYPRRDSGNRGILIGGQDTSSASIIFSAGGEAQFKGDSINHLLHVDHDNDGIGIGGEWSIYDREEGGPVEQRPLLLMTRVDETDHPPFVGLAANDGASRTFTLTFLRARGSVGSFEALEEGDVVGQYFFEGFDGDAFIRGGIISCEVASPVGIGEMPLRLVFKNTEFNTPEEVGAIGPTGDWTFGGPATNPAHTLSQSGAVIFNQRNSQVGDVRIKGQNTDALFYSDASEESVAVGTTTFGTTTRIGGSNTTAFRDKFLISTSGNSDTYSLVIKRRTSNVERPGRLVGYRERGTASAVNVKSGDPMFEILAQGYNGTDASNAARIRFEAGDSNFSTTTSPGAILLQTMPDSSYTFETGLKVDERQSTLTLGRLQESQGGNVSSSGTLTLGTDGNHFNITGTTTINYIDNTDWQDGAVISFKFTASVTVTHNAASPTVTDRPIFLKAGSDLSATADTTLLLRLIGNTWYEL